VELFPCIILISTPYAYLSYTTTTLKQGVSEKVEREAFLSGYRRGLRSCLTERSDGFAAHPLTSVRAKNLAREAALNEALERFVWATWWDHEPVAYSVQTHEIAPGIEKEIGIAGGMLLELEKRLPMRRLNIIAPNFQFSTGGKEVLILVAETESGVITGGACGDRGDREKTLLRAAAELVRHALVLVQGKTRVGSFSFYEKRLLYFASPEGREKFRKRLSVQGSETILLPELSIDEEVSHSGENSHVVYRCLFRDQPPFVGGALERMCL